MTDIHGLRFGIDLGGTKIEIAALDSGGTFLLRERVNTPRGDYGATVRTIAELVRMAETMLGSPGSVGLAIPGTVSAATGLVKNANSTCLIGKPLGKDLEERLGRRIRLANDANCFALSEAADGAGKHADTVFGVILGTGVGGGVVVRGQALEGTHGIAGEWGHNALPRPYPEELPGPECYCGHRGCIESWCSGPALTAHFRAATGRSWTPTEIVASAGAGDTIARGVFHAYLDRLARALSSVVNILDPDAIVLGGGLSNIDELYRELPGRVAAYAFTPEGPIAIHQNRHGDSSGVRGAAWLWSPDEVAQGLPQ